VDIPARLAEDPPEGVEAPDPPGRRRLRDWSLVLEARRVPYKVRSAGRGETILVPPTFAERALREVASFERENPEGLPEKAAPVFRARAQWPAAWLPLALLMLFHLLTRTSVPSWGLYRPYWLRHGAADAEKILDGSWWRAATALTLHGDAAHLVSNVVVGGVLAWLVLREVGAGAGWAGIMLAGVAGNLLTAWVLGPGHLSVGFSTAVFGAAGMLAGLSGLRPARRRPLRFAPLAAGLGLLAMLGAGGENTDLTAHLFGFAAGVPAGLGCAWLARAGRLPEGRLDAGLAVAAWMIPVLGWGLSGYP
jgi:membrane associated rhomboid family serine protease